MSLDVTAVARVRVTVVPLVETSDGFTASAVPIVTSNALAGVDPPSYSGSL